jgi:hypothetical protein
MRYILGKQNLMPTIHIYQLGRQFDREIAEQIEEQC